MIHVHFKPLRMLCLFISSSKWMSCISGRLLNDRNIYGSIESFGNSQAALLFLKSYSFTTLLLRQCKQELTQLRQQYKITLVWITAHRDNFGIEQSDDLWRLHSTLSLEDNIDDILMTLQSPWWHKKACTCRLLSLFKVAFYL